VLSPFGGLKKVFGGVNKAVKKVGGGAFGAVNKAVKGTAGVADSAVRAVTPLPPKKKKTAIGPPISGGTAISRMSKTSKESY